MPDQPGEESAQPDTPAPTSPAPDYEYDLAHEAPDRTPPPPPVPAAPSAGAPLRTEDEGGDYGYDLAHGR